MKNNVLIIDDNFEDDDPLKINLSKESFKVNILKDSNLVLEYLSKNKCDIIILDLQMPDKSIQGNILLEEIRTINNKMPIIIRSAAAKNQDEEYKKALINNDIRGYFDKTIADNKKIILKIKTIQEELENDIECALEDWIVNTHKPNEILLSTKGKTYTASDILKEIQLKTSIGMQFEKDLNKLTIDLLSRGKEKIE